MCWIAWKNLTKSKAKGGLGFRDLESFNDALLAKISWRLLTKPDCLLARILRGKYYHSVPFLESKPSSNSSHGWRGVCIGNDLLKRQLGKVIGEGKQTKLWREPWLSTTKPLTPMGPPTKKSHNLCVSHLVSPTSLTWDRTKIQLLLPEYEKEIMEIRLSKLGATDAYAWLPSKTGLYTAKSGYYERIKHDEDNPPQQTESDTFKWSSDIWQLKTSPKMKFHHLWKAMRGALPVGANLQARQINAEAKCPFCGDTETTHHLFLTCQFASQVWELAPAKTPLALNRISSFRDLVEKAKFILFLPPCGLGEGPLFPWIIWTIRLARNKKIFNDRTVSPREAITQAISLAREWFAAQVATPQIQKQTALPLRLVDPTTISCHTDAAWNEDLKAAGFGWIFNNQQEDIHTVGSDHAFHIRSPLLAEAIALHQALQNASDLGFTNLSFASDSKQLIDAINSETPHKELHGILHDILQISSTFHQIRFNFVPREKNREADALAKRSLTAAVPLPV